MVLPTQHNTVENERAAEDVVIKLIYKGVLRAMDDVVDFLYRDL